jgi:tetratricopeptide (TPR) repeat protein
MVISMRKSIFHGGLILSLLLMICNPLVADGELGLSDDLFTEGQYEKAIAAYEAELQVTDDPAPVYNNLAAAYYQIGNDRQAKHYFQLAAEAAPDNRMPWLNLATLYEFEGDLDAAKESYLKASASTEPMDVEAEARLRDLRDRLGIR